MLYYKVPATLDNKRIYRKKNNKNIYSGLSYIGGELLTPYECKKYGFDTSLLLPVEVKKNNTYFFFGARFEK